MEYRVLTVKDVSANEFIAAYAAYLKRTDKIDIPAWVEFVKTGKHKELPPYDPDWLYIRAAALARKVYLCKHLGVGALKKIYGGKKRFGTAPSHFVTGSGKIIRYLLDQLTKKGIIEYEEEEKESGKQGGRKITRRGQQELDSIAKQLAGSS
uniref:40S ribosomal protein S19 n=1 Tax=Fabrea salina TaxID=342563 RepID=A0A7S3IB29_9CILI|mmetsp:Transcript_460/g.784  ORF Transcript_460/g.784 Transcript_460/m.784 type:complete len:152 (+) Transcript_460:30-485(+)